MRRRVVIAAVASAALSGCVTRPILSTPPATCSKLIPTSWQQPVEAAPVPANAPDADWLGKPLTQAVEAALIAPWANGYVAQDGQLAKANERTAAVISIQAQCEAQVNAARPKD